MHVRNPHEKRKKCTQSKNYSQHEHYYFFLFPTTLWYLIESCPDVLFVSFIVRSEMRDCCDKDNWEYHAGNISSTIHVCGHRSPTFQGNFIKKK